MMKKRWWILVLGIWVAACAETGPTAPKEGRISIYQQTTEIAQKSQKPQKAQIGQPGDVTEWVSKYANSHNNRPESHLSIFVREAWKTSIGSGISLNNAVLVSPIVQGDVIYTLDSAFQLQATRLDDGQKMWRRHLPVADKIVVKSIGLAYHDNLLFAVAGDGHIVAVDLKGKIVWTQETDAALRAGPVIVGKQLFVTTLKNDVLSFAVADGQPGWVQKGQPATTTFLGMATPAANQKMLIVPTTTGLVQAYQIKDGRLAWTETMWASRTFQPVEDLPHMTASPVIDGKIVYLVGNAGKTGAYQVTDGRAVWTKPWSGRTTPVVSGKTLFMVDNDNKVSAVNVKTGQVFWQKQLTTEGDVVWQSPVLAGGYLIITSSRGDIIWLDALTGAKRRQSKTDRITVPPIVVKGRLILLTEKGDLRLYVNKDIS